MVLTPWQWQLLEPLLAEQFDTGGSSAANGDGTVPARGRPPVDRRLVLQAILWKLSTGAPWYDLPESFPSHQTCYRYYRRWCRSGFLDRLLRRLYLDLRQRGGFKLEEALFDGRVRVYRRGRRWTHTVDPSLVGAWQLATARIFIHKVVRQLRRSLK
jgi:transposase